MLTNAAFDRAAERHRVREARFAPGRPPASALYVRALFFAALMRGLR